MSTLKNWKNTQIKQPVSVGELCRGNKHDSENK